MSDVTEAQHPIVAEHQASATVADTITTFAGTMRFVYIHVVIFGVWCATGLFGIDRYPFNFLTMSVSLEAIFLSTFVMIGQNRQAAFAQAKADHDYQHQEAELRTNTELTQAVHGLTAEIHAKVVAPDGPLV